MTAGNPIEELMDAVKESRWQRLFFENEEQWKKAGRLAMVVEQRFSDPAMTRAAFFYHIPSAGFDEALPRFLEPDALRILLGAQRFKTLSPADEALQRQLHGEILPALVDLRAHLLFVAAEIERVDPDNHLSQWLGTFQRSMNFAQPFPDLECTLTPEVPADWSVRWLRDVVAPVARLVGQWHEVSIAEDAAFALSDRGQLEQILVFLNSADAQVAVKARVSSIHGPVQHLGSKVDAVRWEWHHLDRIRRALGRDNASSHWLSQLGNAGFVAVICTTEDACYRALGSLHQGLGHDDQGQLHDLLGHPTRTGYRSIHTSVRLAGDKHSSNNQIDVRVVPMDVEAQRVARADRSHPEISGPRPFETDTPTSLVVYTPDRRPIRLPVGSTVLNYAFAIHSRLIVLARGARVNQEHRDLLQPLLPHDVVWLDVRDTPRPLPVDWEQHVPSSTVRPIRQAFNRYYLPEMVGRGRLWLREQLAIQHQVADLPDNRRLDFLVQRAQRDQGASLQLETGAASWWLEQIGIYKAIQNGEDLISHLRIDGAMLSALVGRVVAELEISGFATQLGVTGDGTALTVQRCAVCVPGTSATEYSATVEGTTIVLHHREAECGRQGSRVVRPWQLGGPQYLVIIGSDRAGLAADVLQQCYNAGVGLVEVSAARGPAAQGLIRLRVDSRPQAELDALTADIKTCPGVSEVLPPNAQESELEIQLLGPRLVSRARVDAGRPWMLATPPLVPPVTVGSFIDQEQHFYGMEGARQSLKQKIAEVTRSGAQRGARIFVSGPLKIGKTSLVQAVLRDLRESAEVPTITAFVSGVAGQEWDILMGEMLEELHFGMRVAAAVSPRDLPENLTTLSLSELVDCTQRTLRCTVVLVVDEVVGLFQANVADDCQQKIREFSALVDSTPGVAVVSVGPAEPVLRLPYDLQRILSTSQEITPPPLSVAETKALLLGAKTGSLFRIELEASIPGRVRSIAGGNPYYIAALVSALWRLAAAESSESFRFNRYLLKSAIEEVTQKGGLFVDRIDIPNRWSSDRQRLAMLLMAELANSLRPRRLIPIPVSEKELVRRLRDDPRNPTNVSDLEDELKELLEELQVRGTVQTRKRRREGQLWWVPPLLALHIQWIQDRPVWRKAWRQAGGDKWQTIR